MHHSNNDYLVDMLFVTALKYCSFFSANLVRLQYTRVIKKRRIGHKMTIMKKVFSESLLQLTVVVKSYLLSPWTKDYDYDI